MALLNFLKFINRRGENSGGFTSSQSTLLPDPDSSLNKVIPSSAIVKANEIVTPHILPAATNHGHTGERGPYVGTCYIHVP